MKHTIHQVPDLSAGKQVAESTISCQLILVAEIRSVDMNDIPAHPLGPLPWDMKEDLAHSLSHCHGHWQKQMGPYDKQTKPHLPQSLRKMYLLQKLSELHQPASLMGWVWYKGLTATTKHLHDCLAHGTECGWTEW